MEFHGQSRGRGFNSRRARQSITRLGGGGVLSPLQLALTWLVASAAHLSRPRSSPRGDGAGRGGLGGDPGGGSPMMTARIAFATFCLRALSASTAGTVVPLNGRSS